MSNRKGGQEITVETIPFDPRFPQTNQSLACFINYVDYYRCTEILEGDNRCDILKKFFTTICPNDWINKWDDMRQNGTFPHPIIKVPSDYCDKGKTKC